MEQDELHTFTDTMLPGCFHLLDELPDTVYRVCDLIMTAIKRNGADYRDMILKQVVNQVSSPGARRRECMKYFFYHSSESDLLIFFFNKTVWGWWGGLFLHFAQYGYILFEFFRSGNVTLS